VVDAIVDPAGVGVGASGLACEPTLVVYRPQSDEMGGRISEPVTIGVPLREGACSDAASLRLIDELEAALPLQARVLERWSDGSIRWVLIDAQVTVAAGRASYRVIVDRDQDAPSPASPISVEPAAGGFVVDTGAARFEIGRSGFPFGSVRPKDGPAFAATQLRVVTAERRECVAVPGRVVIEDQGPLRTTALVEASIQTASGERVLDAFARIRFFAGLATAEIDLTIRNSKRAVHEGGFWELGDPGSVLIKEAAVECALTGGVDDVWCSVERGDGEGRYPMPFELYQDSSGGEQWHSTNHVNRDGNVPLTFRGYVVRAGGAETRGLRATPILTVQSGAQRVGFATEHFWQNFPKALTVTGDRLSIGLFPEQFADAHEIQGGEQKTHRFSLAFDEDSLEWVRSPLIPSIHPSWCADAGAVPYLCPEASDPNSGYLGLIHAAVDGASTFETKREIVDEYGWRNFGDIYADHEGYHYTGPKPVVSHYNNQYDAIAGFAIQFLRTGDVRWWRLMDELARHVVDIDLYHTDDDRPLYNHGLFWHTGHYTDAGRSTHRSYSRNSGTNGGGPSAQHGYSTGLLLHYLLTGSASSKQAVLELAEWVVAMEDGRRTVFSWVDRGPTGWATVGPFGLQGPTRASGNSIQTLINGARLSGDPRFLTHAEQLIRRSIHPQDDFEALELGDVERRWSYTVFLEALGRYLDFKIERGEIDLMYAYARASLLHYARWMAAHEYPALDKPDILEFPTETWAAQDMRKSEAFKFAAKHATPAERTRFLERADFFFDSCVDTLLRMDTRTYARPVVLLLSRGYMHAGFDRSFAHDAPRPSTPQDFGRPVRFDIQKTRAIRKAVAVAAACGFIGLAGAAWWLIGAQGLL
jgi:hypothetical protein